MTISKIDVVAQAARDGAETRAPDTNRAPDQPMKLLRRPALATLRCRRLRAALAPELLPIGTSHIEVSGNCSNVNIALRALREVQHRRRSAQRVRSHHPSSDGASTCTLQGLVSLHPRVCMKLTDNGSPATAAARSIRSVFGFLLLIHCCSRPQLYICPSRRWRFEQCHSESHAFSSARYHQEIREPDPDRPGEHAKTSCL